MRIQLKSNIKDVRKGLKGLEKKGFPIAASDTLTSLAFGYRKDVIHRVWPRSVQVKQRNFARAAFFVERSNKNRGNRRYLKATLFDRLNRDVVFPLLIEGGTRIPYSSDKLAIPTRAALTSTGRVKRAARLGAAPNSFRATIKGIDGIWQRYGRGQSKIRLLYTLVPKVFVPRHFPFYREGERFAARLFDRYFRRNMRRQLARINAR